jgi:hypothetical protein
VTFKSEQAARRAALAPLRGNERQLERAGCCPVIHAFLRRWSEDLSPSEIVTLLAPLVARLPGTRDPALHERRALMALDWVVRVNMPAWRLAASCAERAANPGVSRIVSAPDPGPEITCVKQLPALVKALSSYSDGGLGAAYWATDHWAHDYHEADAAEAVRNHFRMTIWRRSEAAVLASASIAALSAACSALERSQDLSEIWWRTMGLANSAAAKAASKLLWSDASRDLLGAAYASQWASAKARLQAREAGMCWHTHAPHALRQHDVGAWLTFLARAAIDFTSVFGWDDAASKARRIAVSMSKHRAESTHGALRPTREALQRSAIVLVNDMMELQS